MAQRRIELINDRINELTNERTSCQVKGDWGGQRRRTSPYNIFYSDVQSNEQGSYTPDFVNNSYGTTGVLQSVQSFSHFETGYISQYQPAQGLRPTLPQRPVAKPKRRVNKSSSSSDVAVPKMVVPMTPRCKQPDISPVDENEMPSLKRVKEFLGQREGKRARKSSASDDEGVQLIDDNTWLNVDPVYGVAVSDMPSALREDAFCLDDILELASYTVTDDIPNKISHGSPGSEYSTDSAERSPYTDQLCFFDNLPY